MADLLIKGMDMPTMPETFKQAERVPYIDVRIFADGTAVTSKGERPYYTQYSAVPVPPHGRMIDADELKELFRETITGIATRTDMKGAYEHMIRASAMVIEMIDDAPTVIEASEEGE